MSAWSTEILGDDFACDVHGEFMEAYDLGKDLGQIRQELVREHAESIANADKGPIFWLALAQAQWECGALESDIKQRVEEIVLKGLGLSWWSEGTAPDLHERQKVLRNFCELIQAPPASPRKRRERKLTPPIFRPGACLSVHLPNGHFGAALVLSAGEEHETFGKNLIGILAYRSVTKPSISVFEKRKWLKTKRHIFFRRKELLWLLAQGFADSSNMFENVGQVKLRWLDPHKTKVSASNWRIIPTIIQKSLPEAI